MMTINTIGRITKELELKKSEKGCVYVNFGLAVNEWFGDKQKTTFFDCTLFNGDAERLVKAKAKKGSLIQVTGKFGTSEFTRTNGEPGYSLNITVLAWNYIPGTNGQKDANGTSGNNAPMPNQNVEASPMGDYPGVTDLDDEDMPL